MQIHKLAKDIGIQTKAVLQFLKDKGCHYKSSFNKITSEEESMVRKYFSSAENRKAAESVVKKESSAVVEVAPKVVSTIIRRRGERKRSFIPEDERSDEEIVLDDDSPVMESQSEESETANITEPETSEEISTNENSEDVVAEQRAETSVEAAIGAEEKSATVPEKDQTTEREKTITTADLKDKAPLTDKKEEVTEHKKYKKPERAASPDRPERKEHGGNRDKFQNNKPASGSANASQESDSDSKRKKKKKKIVMVPDGETKATDQNTNKSKAGKKPLKGVSPGKSTTKVKGGNIDYIVGKEGSSMEKGRRSHRRKDKKKKGFQPQPPANPTKAIKKIIKIEGSATVAELSKRMGLKSAIVIKKMFDMGEMATLNDRIDIDMATLLAVEFGYQIENVAMSEDHYIETLDDKEEELLTRPPVVTVMGHVDHGKTKLLDAIRNTNVVDREAGGITQHIGAYTVSLENGDITFLDTPGHEAFTAMRSRGAQATDLVILIVAADDGVMPQTVEAINHAKAAKVPIIVAVNKIDKPDSNPERVRQELTKYEIVPEEWGGENLFVDISAKQRINIDDLLENILLQVEVMELKANPAKQASGVVIESRMDQGRGPVATTLVREGTLKIGELVVVGTATGYVRSMVNWKGAKVKKATPSMAVEITGLDSVPAAGEKLHVFKDEKRAKGLVELRKNKMKEERVESQKKSSMPIHFITFPTTCIFIAIAVK